MTELTPRENEVHLTTILEEVTHHLTTSLTILFARTQMLQRGIRCGKIGDVRECLPSLDAITRSAQDIEKDLSRLHAIARTRRRARASDHGGGSDDTWTGDERLL